MAGGKDREVVATGELVNLPLHCRRGAKPTNYENTGNGERAIVKRGMR